MKTEKKEKLIEEWICKVLMHIGILPHLAGYYLLKDAILLTYGSMVKRTTNDIYNILSSRINKTVSSIERNIRVAITRAFDAKTLLKINALFDVDFVDNNYCLTNSQLISIISSFAYSKFGAKTEAV